MTFLAPWFLLGLFAAAIPLLLHLRRSRRQKKIIFSNTLFFDEQFIRSARRARLQDLLLMFLRMALIMLFALALAQPLIKSGSLAGLNAALGQKRQVVIVLDNSASMALADAQGSLLDQAKTAALTILSELNPARGDKAALVFAGQRDAGLVQPFEELTNDLSAVKASVQQAQPLTLTSDLAGAIAVAARLLGAQPSAADSAASTSGQPSAGTFGGTSGVTSGGGGAKEIYVFSDLQQGSLTPADTLALDPTLSLIMVAVQPGAAQRENTSVDALQFASPRPVLGVPFTVRALLTNHGNTAATRQVQLFIDDQPVAEKTITIPAQRAQLLRLSHRFAAPGWYRGAVKITSDSSVQPNAPDALPSDDQRHFVTQVNQKLNLLAINGAPSAVPAQDELFFLQVALRVAAAADDTSQVPAAPRSNSRAAVASLESIALAQADPQRWTDRPLIILANVAALPDALVTALEKYVDQGGNLLITLGDRVNPQAWNQLTGEHRLHQGLLPARLGHLIAPSTSSPSDPTQVTPQVPALAPAQDAGFIASLDSTHPVLAGFEDGQLGSLTHVRFTARYALTALDGDVLMRGPAGDPIMMEKRFGRGRVILFASSLDRDWTDLPLQPAFVPLMYRLTGYLAQSNVEGFGFIRTGQLVQLPTPTTNLQPLQVVTPSGALAYPDASLQVQPEPGRLPFGETEQAGVYQVRIAGEQATEQSPTFWFAANLPALESVLRYEDRDSISPLISGSTAWNFVDSPQAIAASGPNQRQGVGLWNQLLFLALLAALFEPWLANRLARMRGNLNPVATSSGNTPQAQAA